MNATTSHYSANHPQSAIRYFGQWSAILFLLAFTSVAKAQTTPPESEAPPENITAGQVVAVLFQGNNSLSSDELGSITTTKVTSGLSRGIHSILKSFGSDYQALSLAALANDTTLLDQYYQGHGFIDAHSTYQVRANKDDLHTYYEYIKSERLTHTPNAKGLPLPQVRDTVIFIINEGVPYTISHVAIEGLESLPNEFQPDLTEHVTIKSGAQWSQSTAASEVQRLINILIENGYPNARYDSIIVQHRSGFHTVNILLYFRPGHRYRYGQVHIVYDTSSLEKSRVSNNVIRSQLYIDSGHWYKFSEIQRSEAALNRLGTFDFFRISLDTSYVNQLPDSLRDSAIVPVEISLRMKQRWEITPGVFLGLSTQRDDVLGASLNFANKNFTQNADNVSAQGSWQPFPTSLIRYSGNLDYALPFIPFVGLNHIPLILGVGYSHQIETIKPTDTFISISAHGGSNIVISQKDNRTTISPDGLIDYVNTITQDSTIRATAPAQQINLIGSLTYQDNQTNDIINPTAGSLFSTSLEIGFPSDLFYSPSSAYLKAVPQIKEYFDLSGRGTAVIAFHVQAGATYLLQSFDTSRDPSLDRRFYGGGATSNRGWSEQSLLVSQDRAKSAIEGGYNDLEASLEFRFAPFQYPGEFTDWQKYSSPIRIVLFYDLGNVWDNSAWSNTSQALAFNMMAQSIGFGLRYNTFFGALRVDWGFKLYDPSGQFDNSQSSIAPGVSGGWLFNHKFLSLGNTSNIHFGIGQAF
jgi:outer membrane protein assembly factor BamA